MLQVTDLSCVRGDRRLFKDLSFSIDTGELVYLRGHNGSGKTTLLRTLCGLVEPSHGNILWQQESIYELQEDYRQQLLYIGHKNGIKGDLTGAENLQIISQLDGWKIREDDAWNALESVGLRGFEDLPVRVLSQGQQRRVALARLVVAKAKLWILDEPFTALDVDAVAQLQDLIRHHISNNGLVILTTHQDVELTQGTVKTITLGFK